MSSVLLFILQSLVSSLVTVVIILGTLYLFPHISQPFVKSLSPNASEELPLYPINSTFFGLPIPAEEQGIDSLVLTLHLKGKVFATVKRVDGINLTIQSPQNRIYTLLVNDRTKIVNGEYANLESLLTVGRDISLIETFDLRTRIKQMEQLTIQ